MTTETELKQLDRDVSELDRDTIRTNKSLLSLTRWIIMLTAVMIMIGAIQLIVMWPKRTYCVTIINSRVQVCEPDYWPYDTNPSSAAYQIDQKLNVK